MSQLNTPIYDITTFTLVDYPNHASCVVWFSGCNMKCEYCYNPHIIPQKSGSKTIEELLKFLDTRVGLLDAVVLSGGEATSYADLTNLCKQIKAKGFKIKLDTNGSNPTMIKELLDHNLLDYVAIDIKAGNGQKFKEITKSSLLSNLNTSLYIISSSGVDYECRTTIHQDLLSHEEVIECIELSVSHGYDKPYGLQFFSENDGKTIGSLSESKNYNQEKLLNDSPLDIDFRNFNKE